MAKKEATLFLKVKDFASNNIDKLKKAFLGLSAGVAAFGTASLVAFGKFQDKFTNVVTLLDKGSFKTKTLEGGIESLKKGVLELGRSSGESFENLNQGLFDLVSAGVPAEQAIQALRVATELATAGATDTAVAVDGITSALNAYSLDASMATEVSQKFFQAQKGGKTTVAELSSGFGLVASTANAFGVSLDELLGSVAAVTLGGVKTSQAYTGLNAVLAGVAKPTADATAEAKRLGIEFNSTALRSLGLKGFLDQLTNANGFTKQSVEKLFGSVEAQKIMFSLTGGQADAFADQLAGLADKQGLNATFATALAEKQKTVSFRFNQLKRSGEAFLISVGEKLGPLLDFATVALDRFGASASGTTSVVSGMVSLIKGLAHLVSGVALGFEELGITIGVRLAAAVESATLLAQGKFKEASQVFLSQNEAVNAAQLEAQQAHQERLDALYEVKKEEDAARNEEEVMAKTMHENTLAAVKAKARATEKVLSTKEIAAAKKAREKKAAAEKQLEDKRNAEKLAAQKSTQMLVASLSQSGNKTLASIGKAAALTQIAIDTPAAISKAMTVGPPPINFIAAAAVGAAMASQAAAVSGVQLAEGGIVRARPGGIQAIIGEGGQDEAVIPLDDERAEGIGGNLTIVVNGGLLGDPSSAREFALAVDEQLTELRRNNESNAFDEDII